MAPCQHYTLQLEASPFAALAGYERPDARKRLAATLKSGRPPPRGQYEVDDKELSKTFPAPLVLPHDELNYDPTCPPQSFRSWLNEKARNKITPERKTLYVAAVPEIDPSVSFMRSWINPRLDRHAQSRPSKRAKIEADGQELASPHVDDFVEYLSAFYHGLEVKPFPIPLRWLQWATKSKSARSTDLSADVPKYVALGYGHQSTRIRARSTPKSVFPAQLNLDDILDAAIEMLPADAYSIVLLVDHDIYESEDDDFCCGRAYGGSRVAVVQTARYHPVLDNIEKIDYEHMWPASHCKVFVDKLCAVEDVKATAPSVEQVSMSQSGPIRAAITATLSIPELKGSDPRPLWFSRLARTVVHELGHCFGIGHCTYYACIMQGTVSLNEDVRQPPYLCQICLTKVSYAVSTELRHGDETRVAYMNERYRVLMEFCQQWAHVGMFAGFGAWIEERLNR